MKDFQVKFRPNSYCIEPEFDIQIDFKHSDKALPISYSGVLKYDEIVFARLYESSLQPSRETYISSVNGPIEAFEYYSRSFVAPLSKIALTKLEELRSKNTKGDLKFKIDFSVEFIEPTFSAHTPTQGVSKNFAQLGNAYSLLKHKIQTKSETVTIYSSDWIHDFCPAFGTGKFHVFEFPIPDITIRPTDALSLALIQALKSLQEMEDSRNKGDWKRIILESRPVWELIKDNADVERLLINCNYDNDTIYAFKNLIQSFFTFASKFAHLVGHPRQGSPLMPHKEVSKEDAEMMYAMAISTVNMVVKKQ